MRGGYVQHERGRRLSKCKETTSATSPGGHSGLRKRVDLGKLGKKVTSIVGKGVTRGGGGSLSALGERKKRYVVEKDRLAADRFTFDAPRFTEVAFIVPLRGHCPPFVS